MIEAVNVDFNGAKLALFLDDSLLVYQRDQREDIPYPGLLDLPGGGRERNESPVACVLRELHEEFALVLPEERVRLVQCYTIPFNSLKGYFFSAILRPAEQVHIRFGAEGQWWQFMPVKDFLSHPRAIAHLQELVRAVWAN